MSDHEFTSARVAAIASRVLRGEDVPAADLKALAASALTQVKPPAPEPDSP